MSDPAVIDAEHETFWITFLRTELAALAGQYPVLVGVKIARSEPEAGHPFPEKLIVVRDDGTSDTSLITGDTGMGISCFAGSRESPKPAMDIARIVKAVVKTAPRPAPGNPVAVIRDINGPYLVAEAALRARAYLNFTAGTVAEAL